MEIVAVGFVIASMVVGVVDGAWWWILGTTAGCTAVSVGLRREQLEHFQSLGPKQVMAWILTIYALQLVTLTVTFLVGIGVGKLLKGS